MHIVTELENLPEVRRAWTRVRETVSEGCQRGVRVGCTEGAKEALSARKWKSRTGKAAQETRGYVTQMTRDGAEGVLECAVEYASFLDSGTVPHEIRPKASHGFVGPLHANQSRRAKNDIGTHRVALRWYDGGGNPRFAAVVHHPGTTGDGFFGKAYQKTEAVMVREVEVSVVNAQRVLDS